LQAGLPEIVYGGHGSLPPDLWVYKLRAVHYALSRVLMVLIALHLAGVVYHMLIRRDGLLRRMAFGRRTRASTAAILTAP
jgi:cytochrome b561